MTFEQLWNVIRKRWILVISCCLLVGIGALLGSKLLEPQYQSSVIVQVMVGSSNINQANYDGLLASQQLAQTESTLATSSSVLRVVASHYHNLAASQVAAEVSASPKTNTSLFEIDVIDPDPAMAAALANDIAATLIEQQVQATQHSNTLALQQIQAHLNQLTQQISDTTTQMAQAQARINSKFPIGDPEDKTQLTLLQTQLSNLQQSYNAWQSSLIQLQLAEAQSVNPLSVVQPALPSSSPAQPNIKLNTGGGLVAGLLLGLLLALLVDQLDKRVRTEEEFARILGWPTLGTIWRVKSPEAETSLNPTGNKLNAEQYRIMRTNIGFASMNKPLHTLIVTSALPQEGKSSIAANLAIFMARAGKNTLLIDADLRRPFQHTFFQLLPQTPGLSNAVLALSTTAKARTLAFQPPDLTKSPLGQQNNQAAANLALTPFTHTVGIPNLRVMPAGPLPPNPSEFLESKPMQHFLSLIEESDTEIVILDTPPLLGLSDTSILASKVDGVLVVVDATVATRKKLGQMKNTLTQTGVHVLGYVGNKLKHTRTDDTYLYYMEAQKEAETVPGELEESPWNEQQPAFPPALTNDINPHPTPPGIQANAEPLPALTEKVMQQKPSLEKLAKVPLSAVASVAGEDISQQHLLAEQEALPISAAQTETTDQEISLEEAALPPMVTHQPDREEADDQQSSLEEAVAPPISDAQAIVGEDAEQEAFADEEMLPCVPIAQLTDPLTKRQKKRQRAQLISKARDLLIDEAETDD